ncbi:MAG: hypothetical protein JWO36_1993 [Myxococcales bacterium]|nr:hypothetical protein [Myxococcales bacterium]
MTHRCVVHCPSNHLCDRCLEQEIDRLRGAAAARGVEWAIFVASHVSPERAWPEFTGAFVEHTRRKVADLASDKRLRTRLAEICAAAAARHWAELIPKR